MSAIALERLAALPHGVFTPADAIAAGIDSGRLARLRRSGRVVRVAGRGHVVGHVTPTITHRVVAARLTWPDAIVCFLTAAVLLGLPVDDDGAAHVLVPNGRKPLPGIVPHYWSVRPTQVVARPGFTMTDRPTTVSDCLGRLPEYEAWGLVAWMRTRDLLEPEDVEAQLAERSHLYGVVRLRAMAATLRRGVVSLTEVQLVEFLESSGFVGWVSDEKIWDGSRIVARADVLFVAERLVLEYDGRLSHGPSQQARDARRAEQLRRLGYRILRVRWERLMDQPYALRQEIREALAAGVAVERGA